jgi:hypothetical protein
MKKQLLVMMAIVVVQSLMIFRALAVSEDLLKATVRPGKYRDGEFSSALRLTAIGAGIMPGGEGQGKGFSGGVFADYGRRWLSFEAGVQYLNTPVGVKLTDPNTQTSLQSTNINAQYVGTPLYVRYNYIEQPMAIFSVKLGGMPAFLVSSEEAGSYYDPSSGGQTILEIPQNDFFAMGGFTGTAPLTERLAFVVDGTYFYGVNAIDAQNNHNQGFVLGAGLRFAL